MVEPTRTRKVDQQELLFDLAKMEMVEALKHGDNIYKVLLNLPKGITSADFEKFMGQQFSTLKSQILQDTPIYESYASVPEPIASCFYEHRINAFCSPLQFPAVNIGVLNYRESKRRNKIVMYPYRSFGYFRFQGFTLGKHEDN